MKVLWFEISQPSGYENDGHVVLGWQDALEDVVRFAEGLELHIAFESTKYSEIRYVNGVTYHPIKTSYSWWESKKKQWDFSVYSKKVVTGALKVIEEVKPDLIHVFGNEWPFGLVSEFTRIPVVVHIQGCMIPLVNAYYPPGYNIFTMLKARYFNIYDIWLRWKELKRTNSRLETEKRAWNCVHHYMGRTIWDKALVNTLANNASYHHVDEALRPSFLTTTKKWNPVTNDKLKIVTTGISSFWKGPDMMLKTARILKQNGIDFEWNVAGVIEDTLKTVVEKTIGTTFAENNIRILGFTQPSDLVDLLCSSTMYVHTAYIENSPNSICEAQYLGLPIVSTHVGGIESLLDFGNDGVLVPANDPWRMADAIMRLFNDKKLMALYSTNSYKHAHERHNKENIKHDLFTCYHNIIGRP